MVASECVFVRHSGWSGLMQSIAMKSLDGKCEKRKVEKCMSLESCYKTIVEDGTPEGLASGFISWYHTNDNAGMLRSWLVRLFASGEMCLWFGIFSGLTYFVLLHPILWNILETRTAYQQKAKQGEESSATTPFELLRLARNAYVGLGESSPPDSWEHLKRWSKTPLENVSIGIDIYVHKKKRSVVLAVRGTDTSMVSDLLEDAKLLFDKMTTFLGSEQKEELQSEYTEKVLLAMAECEAKFPSYDWILTGHSLGAACCEAAWLENLTGLHALHGSNNFKNWNCVTWESPGFAMRREQREILSKHATEVNKRVIHFLGAPNAINCLHPHINPGRRYRVFLQHDKKLGTAHVTECTKGLVLVVANWIFLIRLAVTSFGGIASKCGNAYLKGKSATEAAAIVPRESIIRWLASPIKAKDVMLAITENAVVHSTNGYDYLLRQHSLAYHLDSIDMESGYPSDFVRMVEWPSFENFVHNGFRNFVRESLVPPSPSDFRDPAHLIEKRIKHLQGYEEAASHLIPSLFYLANRYPFIGSAFFEEESNPAGPAMELKCREHYKSIGKSLPEAFFIMLPET